MHHFFLFQDYQFNKRLRFTKVLLHFQNNNKSQYWEQTEFQSVERTERTAQWNFRFWKFETFLLQITYNSIFCVSLEFQITNMDSECPVCRTTKYRNPSMQMLVNVCGHGLCSSCVETLFARGKITFSFRKAF